MKYIFIILLLVGLFFVIDPFAWWPIDHLVGKPCIPENVSPRCTGIINFF